MPKCTPTCTHPHRVVNLKEKKLDRYCPVVQYNISERFFFHNPFFSLFVESLLEGITIVITNQATTIMKPASTLPVCMSRSLGPSIPYCLIKNVFLTYDWKTLNTLLFLLQSLQLKA